MQTAVPAAFGRRLDFLRREIPLPPRDGDDPFQKLRAGVRPSPASANALTADAGRLPRVTLSREKRPPLGRIASLPRRPNGTGAWGGRERHGLAPVLVSEPVAYPFLSPVPRFKTNS